MHAAAEPVAVAGKPPIPPVGRLGSERQAEDPATDPSARQEMEQPLHGGGPEPRFAARPGELDRREAGVV